MAEMNARERAAYMLCMLSSGITTVMAVIAGLGLTIAVVVLAIKGTITILGALALGFIGVPILGTVVYWIAMILAGLPMLLAHLLSRDVVSWYLDNHAPQDDYSY